MRYSELTRRYFESAPHAGVLLREGTSTPHVGTPHICRGCAGNREQGTWVQFDIEVAATRCRDARFLAFGCPHTIAVAAWVAEQASGCVLHAALPEPVAALAQRFEVPAEKLGRLLIVEDAWLAAATRALTVPQGDPISDLNEL
jgi:NifU-like protein involved in Fe-S cluster formation